MIDQAAVVFLAGFASGAAVVGFIAYMCMSAKNSALAELKHDSELAWRVAKVHRLHATKL